MRSRSARCGPLPPRRTQTAARERSARRTRPWRRASAWVKLRPVGPSRRPMAITQRLCAAFNGWPDGETLKLGTTSGSCAQRGEGVAEDAAAAARWFRRAAEQGLADAQGFLGVMHCLGRGGPRNYLRAHVWMNRLPAGRRGKREGCRVTRRCRETAVELGRAQRMADDWRARTEDGRRVANGGLRGRRAGRGPVGRTAAGVPNESSRSLPALLKSRRASAQTKRRLKAETGCRRSGAAAVSSPPSRAPA